MISYVTGFVFSENRQDLLLLEKLTPKWQKGLYNGIGGKIEQNETPLDAIIRECHEEIGLEISNWLPSIKIIVPNIAEIFFFYTFTDKMYQAQQMEKEFFKIFDIKEIPENIIPNLRWLIPLVLDDNIVKDNFIEIIEKPRA